MSLLVCAPLPPRAHGLLELVSSLRAGLEALGAQRAAERAGLGTAAGRVLPVLAGLRLGLRL